MLKHKPYFGAGAFLLAGSEEVKMASGAMPMVTGLPGELAAETKITVYPNPVRTTLTINAQSGRYDHAQVGIYTLQGAKIYEASQGISFPYQIDFSFYRKGIYLVKVSVGGKSFVKKVVKE